MDGWMAQLWFFLQPLLMLTCLLHMCCAYCNCPLLVYVIITIVIVNDWAALLSGQDFQDDSFIKFIKETWVAHKLTGSVGNWSQTICLCLILNPFGICFFCSFVCFKSLNFLVFGLYKVTLHTGFPGRIIVERYFWHITVKCDKIWKDSPACQLGPLKGILPLCHILKERESFFSGCVQLQS